MNQMLYIVSLALVALVVLMNRGNRNRVHQTVPVQEQADLWPPLLPPAIWVSGPRVQLMTCYR